MQIEPGAQLRGSFVVTDADTAVVIGTGEVPVLSTSRVTAWCEQATNQALSGQLDEGKTSVALRVQVDHIRAVLPGCEVTVLATLERIEGRRLIFVVSVLDADAQVLATGRIVRVIVDTEDFMASACGLGR